MDRIEQLMKNAKPQVGAPAQPPGSDSRPLDRLVHGSQRRPPGTRRTPARRNATRVPRGRHAAGRRSGSGRRRRGRQSYAATRARTCAVGRSQRRPPPPAPRRALHQAGTHEPPTASPTGTAAALTTGGVACTMANVDQQRNDQPRAIIADARRRAPLLHGAGLRGRLAGLLHLRRGSPGPPPRRRQRLVQHCQAAERPVPLSITGKSGPASSPGNSRRRTTRGSLRSRPWTRNSRQRESRSNCGRSWWARARPPGSRAPAAAIGWST